MDNAFELGLCFEMTKSASTASEVAKVAPGFFGNVSAGLGAIKSGIGSAFTKGTATANATAQKAATEAATAAKTAVPENVTAGLYSRGKAGFQNLGDEVGTAWRGLTPEARTATRKAGAGALGVGAFGAGLAI